MANGRRIRKPKTPTVRESLAKISESLSQIADALRDSRGDYASWGILDALNDIAEYGPGKAPKDRYDWRH